MRTNLFVVTEEDLGANWQPSVAADLESLWQAVQNLDLFGLKDDAVDLEVLLNAVLADRLRNDGPAVSDTPDEQHLLHRLALLCCQVNDGLVLVQRRAGRAQARISGGVDTL